MTSLEKLFGFRDARRSRPRRAFRRDLQPERLETRALLAVTVPPSITTDTVEIDDNIMVSNDGGAITATGGPSTSGHVQIFGNSKGRIDGTPGQSNEDLTIVADSFITVTGGIGGIQRPDDLKLTSVKAQPINLQQVVSLTGDLWVTKAGSFTVGSTVTIDGDLRIDEATLVTFSGNVTVGGDLTITQATGVTFAGTLTVGGALTIVNATGTTRFVGDVSVGSASVTSTTLVNVQADFTTTGAAGDGDVTFTTDQINFTTASLGADPAATGATLVIQPRTTSRALTIASPPGIPAGVNITDADVAAIQPGWKRVVFGDEAAGTGAVRIGSIGSQYGGFSQLLNTTTIVGGTVQVVQPVDVTPLAIYLELIARGTGTPGSGAVTIDAPINQTEGERSAWVRLQSAGIITINAPVWANEAVSLNTTDGGMIAQQNTGSAITAPAFGVDADGSVTLADSGNAFSLVAIKTTGDSVVLREDSGYSISQLTTIDDGRDSRPIATVTGIDVGTATVRLVTVSGGTPAEVFQGKRILANGLGLEGAGTNWNLGLATNDIAALAANTGSIVFRDVDDLTIGTVAAISPRSEISGISVARTLDVIAGTTLAITAAGDIISAASSGTAVNLEAPSGISTAGDVITAGSNVEFDHATTLTGDVVFDLEDGPNRGLVTFFDAVDGTTAGQESLTIGGDLDAELSMGAAVALQSLSVSGDSALAGGITLRTTGNQTYSGSVTSVGTITIQAGSGSTVAFLGAASLGGLVTATGDTAAYSVTLTGSPVSITNAVAFANTGTVTLGDAATDSLTFAGGLTSTAPTLTNLAGTISTTNKNATFGTTALTANTTVSMGTGAATFSGTLDGGSAIVVNATGATTFSAAVGGTMPLVSLTTDAGGTTAINGGSIKTSGSTGQVFNDAVTLGNNAALTATNVGAVTFATTLDGAKTLAVNTQGLTTFGGAVGTTAPLVSLTTDAGGTTAINGGSIKTSGLAGQVFGDAVLLGADATLTATNLGAVTFASTVDNYHRLVVNTGGDTTFGGRVGGTDPLAHVETDAPGRTLVNGGLIQTASPVSQLYLDPVLLGADTLFEARVNGAVTFASTLDGGFAATVNTQGLTTFGGVVGTTTPLVSLTTDAGGTTAINGGSITTSGSAGQVFNDAVTLGNNATLTATDAGAVTFATTLDGATTLAVNTQGLTTFGGAVGTTTPLVSLATDAGGTTAITGGSITTSGLAGQVFLDAVMLGNDATLFADNAGAVMFATTLDGAKTLAVNTQGLTTFGGAVGTATPLVSLTTDAGGTTAITGGSIKTSGSAGQVFLDAATLGNDATLFADNDGAVTFATTLDGAKTLAVHTQGLTTFGGAVGTTTPLVSLTTDAGGTTAINGGSIKTSGSAGQVFNDAVTLGNDTTLSAGNLGAITFATSLDGAKTLAVITQGLTAFGGAVGTTTPLVSLTTDAGGTTAINGGSITTSGPAGQVFNDAVTLGNDATLTADNAGAVTFATTLDGAKTLAVNTQGLTTFDGAVGGTTPLVSLATDAGGTTVINGGAIRTSGSAGQVFNDAVTLGNDTTLSAGNLGAITFATSLDGAKTLAVNTQGLTTFGGAVGGKAALVSLTTDAEGTSAINGGTIRTSGLVGQVFNDAVTLGNNATLLAGNTGAVTFWSTVDGARELAVSTSGRTTFNGAVGGTTPLRGLTTDTTGETVINGRTVMTSDRPGQLYNDAVTLGADTVLTANNLGPITFATTLDGPYALSANTQGLTIFGGAVGDLVPLASVVTDAGGITRISGGRITTTMPLVLASAPGDDVGALVNSGQYYSDAVELGANTVLTAGLLTIMPTALIGGDQIAFASTVDGAYSLTVNTVGTTSFNGAVGSGTPLASLATDAGGTTSVTGRLVRTTGSQTYADLLSFEPVVEGDAFDLEVQLAADEDSDVESSIFTPPMTRLAGATVSALQGIAGGGHDLVIEGNAVFGDQPGSLIPDDVPDAIDPIADLNDLRVTGTTTVNSTLIASTGLQTYESGVVLGSDVFFLGLGQRFRSTVTGLGRVFRVWATTAGMVFDGDVGTAAAPLGGVSAIAFGGDVRINAAIFSVNQVFISAVFGSLIGGANNAIRAPGTTITLVGQTGIGVGMPIAVEAASVSALSTAGPIHLRGIGDLVVGEQGWSANGPISLDASGEIRVPGGRTIQAPNRVTATKTIAWSITTTADDGAGSLRQVIDNLNLVGDANKSGLDARLVFDVPRGRDVSAPLVFTISTSLPEIRAAVEIIDSNVVLDGTTVAANGLALGAAASGSVLRGVTLRNFREYGLQLRSTRNVTVDRISVTGLNLVTSMGVYATGNLAGTRVTGSQFTGGLRGMLLDQARGLRVGSTAIGQANTFTGNRSVPSRPTFAGTGIRAQGDCTGTIVEGNTFTGNNYGFGFVAARGLALRSNVFARNTIAGIHVDGNCTGSTQAGNVFATVLPDRNRANVVRVRGSRGI